MGLNSLLLNQSHEDHSLALNSASAQTKLLQNTTGMTSPFSKDKLHVQIATVGQFKSADLDNKPQQDKTEYFSACKDEAARSVMVTLLEQQVQVLQDERDQLWKQKSELMHEVDEYKQMVDDLGIRMKNFDKEQRNEFCEQDDYIDSLEEQLEHAEKQVEAQDQYISNLEE